MTKQQLLDELTESRSRTAARELFTALLIFQQYPDLRVPRSGCMHSKDFILGVIQRNGEVPESEKNSREPRSRQHPAKQSSTRILPTSVVVHCV